MSPVLDKVELTGFYWEWYQIDLRRSMHVSRIEMVFNEKNEVSVCTSNIL
jgi:hypothetical protein